MTARKKATWVLPAVVDPPDSLCFQVHVPNDRQHIAAFYGAIFNLVKPYNWQDDDARTAIAVGAVWGRIFDELMNQQCPIPSIKGIAGLEVEDFMPLRIDCDCNVFVTCCDGTEKQILTSDQVKALLVQQPGVGSIQPPPNGGCQEYTFSFAAGQKWLLPVGVYSGDTVEVLSSDGVSNDGTLTGWFCPDGGEFFAGINTGIKITESGDPLNTKAHMSLIVDINGTFHDLEAGAVTVPGGIVAIQPVIQLNDSALGDNSGNITGVVKVCNNQISTWHVHLDFAASNHSWLRQPQTHPTGKWTPGLGWECECQDPGNLGFNECYIGANFVAHLTRAVATINYTAGTYAGTTQIFAFYDQSGSFHTINNGGLSNGSGQQIDSGAISRNVTNFKFDLVAGAAGAGGPCTGDLTLTALDLYGDGPMPAL